VDQVHCSFWRDRPILITGATGLVGSVLVQNLHAVQADLVLLVRDWVPQSEAIRSGLLEQVKVVRGDLCDQELLERVLGEYEIETVFHLGAQTIVSVANRNPVSTFQSNIAGTWNLLEACRHSPTVKQVIVASSDKAYGHQPTLPYNEDMPLQGVYPYDCSKSCADLIAQSYAETFEVPVCITRCGNFYGPGDLNWSRLIPGSIRSVLRDERPLIRSDGKSLRDYLFVEDGANAYMTVAAALAEAPQLRGQAFNFSVGQPYSVLEVVRHVLKVMNREDLEPEILNQASCEIPEQYLSSQKAQDVLAWRPQYSLETGLRATVCWYQDLLDRPGDTVANVRPE